MKTVKEKFIQMLVNMGMFESQASEVMELAIPKLNVITESYSLTWDSSSDSYPEPIYTVLMLSIKPVALDWIINNKPEAWYKPMFE